MRRAILLMTLALTSATPAFGGRVKLDAPKPVTVSGKIYDNYGKPVDGAQVYLVDHENRLRLSGKSDAEGHFHIKHDRVDFDSLQIVPPAARKLAQATLKDIPASEGRHVVVNLKPGVHVTGRVLAADKPLKGATVRAMSKLADSIHDAAEAVTNKKGEYDLYLTPGEKMFEVTDVDDHSVVGIHREREMIRTDAVLPDIKVPANRTAGTE
jgi:uncharacterized GH25 family protein